MWRVLYQKPYHGQEVVLRYLFMEQGLNKIGAGLHSLPTLYAGFFPQ
jgi:hypothetical protein